MAVPLHGRASATVNNGDADPGWTKLGSDPAKASQMVAQGQLVVTGKKEAGHQRVVVVTPGEGPHQMAIGYWRRLGGVGFKNKNKGARLRVDAPIRRRCSIVGGRFRV